MIMRTEGKIIMKMSDTVRLLDRFCARAENKEHNDYYGHVSKKKWYVPVVKYEVIHDLHYNIRNNTYQDVLVVRPLVNDKTLTQTQLLSKVQHLLKIKEVVMNGSNILTRLSNTPAIK